MTHYLMRKPFACVNRHQHCEQKNQILTFSAKNFFQFHENLKKRVLKNRTVKPNDRNDFDQINYQG